MQIEEKEYSVFVLDNVVKIAHNNMCMCSEHELCLERCVPSIQEKTNCVYTVDHDISTDILMIEFFYGGGYVQNFYKYFNNMINKRVVESFNQTYRIIHPKIKYGRDTQEICLKILDGRLDRRYFLFFKTKCNIHLN